MLCSASVVVESLSFTSLSIAKSEEISVFLTLKILEIVASRDIVTTLSNLNTSGHFSLVYLLFREQTVLNNIQRGMSSSLPKIHSRSDELDWNQHN